MNNLLFGLSLLFCIPTAVGANWTISCPTVEEIKQGKFGYWLPLFQDGEELASTTDTKLFQANVTKFDIARWADWYLENGHCFYKGNHPIVNQIVLAQDAWQPQANPYWAWIKRDKPNKLAECRADPNLCVFEK